MTYSARQNSRTALVTGLLGFILWGTFLDVAAGSIAIVFGLLALTSPEREKGTLFALSGMILGIMPVLNSIAYLT